MENLDISGKSHARRNLLSVLVDADITLDSNLRICFLFGYMSGSIGSAVWDRQFWVVLTALTFGTFGDALPFFSPRVPIVIDCVVAKSAKSWAWPGSTRAAHHCFEGRKRGESLAVHLRS